MFEIVVKEITAPADGSQAAEIARYRQIVDVIDLRAVMAAVNKKPRKSRAKGAQSEQPTSRGPAS